MTFISTLDLLMTSGENQGIHSLGSTKPYSMLSAYCHSVL